MDFSLCPYKYLFGKPNEGVHQYRIFDIAIVDTISTIAAAYLISRFFKYEFKFVLINNFYFRLS
jgi:hypothetical protein